MKKALWTALVTVLLIAMVSVSFADTGSNFQLNKYEAGTENSDVTLIQIALINDGLLEAGHLTGLYDPETEAAVMAFQGKYGLTADGITGPATLSEMDALNLFPVLTQEVYKKGMESPEVMDIQRALKAEGYLAIDEFTEYYGMLTVEAIKEMQREHGLVADGVAGMDTIILLSEMGYVLLEAPGEGAAASAASAQSVIGNLSQQSYEKGADHGDVITIQKILTEEDCFNYDEYTTHYGDVTEEGVKAFQTKYGIEADGVAGQSTIDKFIELGYVTNNLVVSRSGDAKQYGQPVSWYDVHDTFTRGESILTIEDFYTGITFNVVVSYGTNHADIETLTAQDSEIVKSIWSTEASNWNRRPVLVHYDGNVYAASMIGMFHAGLENQPEGAYVYDRSADFGYGYNFDNVKGNGVDGVLCLHFKDSKLHGGNKVDSKHQHAINIAAGLE